MAVVLRDDGRHVEAAPPARLPSDSVTVLEVYGSLFFAGARTLYIRIPEYIPDTLLLSESHSICRHPR